MSKKVRYVLAVTPQSTGAGSLKTSAPRPARRSRPARSSRPRSRAAKPLKLGYVSPQTGPLAAFAEADDFVISASARR